MLSTLPTIGDEVLLCTNLDHLRATVVDVHDDGSITVEVDCEVRAVPWDFEWSDEPHCIWDLANEFNYPNPDLADAAEEQREEAPVS